jgi:hypothetical protein
VAVTPASVPLDEDTPPSPELLDFDTEKFLMGIDLSPGPEEDFSEEDLNAFVITSPKRKRAVSGGGDATEARLNTTATPSAAQAFLHSDHPPQSLAQSAGAAVTGEIENAAPAAVAAVTELMNLNDKLECVTGGADLQAIPFRQVSLLEKAWKRGGVLVDPTRTDAGEIENANTLKKPLTHAAPRPVMFAPAAVAAVAEEDGSRRFLGGAPPRWRRRRWLLRQLLLLLLVGLLVGLLRGPAGGSQRNIHIPLGFLQVVAAASRVIS